MSKPETALFIPNVDPMINMMLLEAETIEDELEALEEAVRQYNLVQAAQRIVTYRDPQY